jgi:hypothetical protein
MAENALSPAAGGFMPPSGPSVSLPSPAPTTSTIRSDLPRPRAHPLRPGSAKEDQVRNFITDRINHITRRFVKKTGKATISVEVDSEVEGYKAMSELCKDLEDVINIVWLSGTPSLQIPSLLNIASEFNTWVAAFPPSPAPTFSILHKLDHCFASLLTGEDIETHESLPGFENGLRSGMSRTDMVRCKSTVLHSRILIVDVMSKKPEEEDRVEDAEQTDDDAESSGPDGPAKPGFSLWDDGEEDDLYMDVARVYENTLVKLGETLGESGVADIQMSAD